MFEGEIDENTTAIVASNLTAIFFTSNEVKYSKVEQADIMLIYEDFKHLLKNPKTEEASLVAARRMRIGKL